MGKKTEVKTDKKRSLRNLATGAVVSLSFLTSFPVLKNAVAATATLPIIVKLIRAIEITVSTSLDFGTLAMTLDRAGEARMDPSQNRLLIDNNSSLALAGGTPTVGRLKVKGAAFPVSVSIEDTIVNLTNGVTSVTVNNFNLITEDGGNHVTITPEAGNQSFTVPVGATLMTKPGQLEGTYVGTTRIFANFQ